jgi:hypothetical protein
MTGIARLIELDEQLTFRCGRQTIAIPSLKKDPSAAGQGVKENEGVKGKKPAAPGQTPDKPAAISIDTPAAPASAEAVPVKPAVKKKASKQKASDAYVAPPSSPGPSPDPVTP